MLQHSFYIDEDNFKKLTSLTPGYVKYYKYNTFIKSLLEELYPSDLAEIMFLYTCEQILFVMKKKDGPDITVYTDSHTSFKINKLHQISSLGLCAHIKKCYAPFSEDELIDENICETKHTECQAIYEKNVLAFASFLNNLEYKKQHSICYFSTTNKDFVSINDEESLLFCIFILITLQKSGFIITTLLKSGFIECILQKQVSSVPNMNQSCLFENLVIDYIHKKN